MFQHGREIKAKYGLAKIVTANNAFAHSDNLIEILESMEEAKTVGIFVFEVKYIKFGQKSDSTIFHEHHSYHSLIPLIKFLKKFNLEIINVERVSIQGGSLIGV